MAFDASIRVNVDDLADLDEVEVLRAKIATFLASEPRAELLGFSVSEVVNP